MDKNIKNSIDYKKLLITEECKSCDIIKWAQQTNDPLPSHDSCKFMFCFTCNEKTKNCICKKK